MDLDINSLVKLSVTMPIAESIGELVSGVTDKLKTAGDDYKPNPLETIIISAAVQATLK